MTAHPAARATAAALTAGLLLATAPPAPAGLSGLVPAHAPRAITADRALPPGGCHYRTAATGDPLPDPACTPGGYDPAVTPATLTATVCAPGWTATVRPPAGTAARWEARAATAYATPGGTSGEFDHLVPLELGGSNALSNLWPEPGPIPNAKDRVENALHRSVCAGQLGLDEARARIAADWTRAARP